MTASDLATYLRALLNGGAGLVTSSGFAALTQRAIAVPGAAEPTWYGYGLNVRDVAGHAYLGHGGGMVGYFAGMIGDLDAGIGVVALVNGPGAPNQIARQLLDYLRAISEGRQAVLPVPVENIIVEDPARFTGRYVAGTSTAPAELVIMEGGAGLVAQLNDLSAPLVGLGDDVLATDHPALALFPLTAVRDGDGEVIELLHGDHVYVRGPGAPRPSQLTPPAFQAITGHYRSHNPWTTGFRVLVRDGKLLLAVPSEPDGLENEQALVPLDDGWFRCGDDVRIPERIRFNTLVDGRALVANLSGSDYYRVNAL
jgi:D-alanyl-D-alanine carboxypeptidase